MRDATIPLPDRPFDLRVELEKRVLELEGGLFGIEFEKGVRRR